MKLQKRLLATLLLVACIFPAFSQFRWGPTVGANFSTYKFKQKLISVDQSVGFNAGVVSEIMFPGIGIGMDFGLQYDMHGAKLHLGEKEVWAADGFGNEQSYLHTIQVPINLRFKYTRLNGVEEKIAPFVYGGPIFSLTVAHSDVKALEYSGGCVMLQCGIGAEILRHYQISAGYCWGMTYETRTLKLDNFSARSRGWKVGLTYLF
jgi:hypothetical protein